MKINPINRKITVSPSQEIYQTNDMGIVYIHNVYKRVRDTKKVIKLPQEISCFYKLTLLQVKNRE